MNITDMPNMENRLRKFAVELYKLNGILLGEYKEEMSFICPMYIDLKVIVSYPKIMNELAELLIMKIENMNKYKLLCGVPYTALLFATVISLKTVIPMVIRRKEMKNYGTKKLIEGKFDHGDQCLIIEDVLTSGSSILETVNDLNNVGIQTTDAIVVVNCQQDGESNLNKNGINIHSLFTRTKLMEILMEEKCISPSFGKMILNSDTQGGNIPEFMKCDRLKMSFEQRSNLTKNTITKRLFDIISKKQTNLCVALDLCSGERILSLAEQLGPHVCIIKIHVDIIEDFSQNFANNLRIIAKSHKFLIMEDRKFADIGDTNALQFGGGIYKISTWADLVTAHSLPGNNSIKALEQTGGVDKGIFLVAEMSSANNLMTENYTKSTIELAQKHSSAITGIVCQNPKFVNIPELIQLTPGIQLNNSRDNLGQQYNTPEYVVLKKGADIGVVGRGITEAINPIVIAEDYKNLLWSAYLKRIEKS